MDKQKIFSGIFKTLQGVMSDYATDLFVAKNESDNYYLETRFIMKNKEKMFLGAVNIKKNYVAYDLMPIYVYPDLLEGLSLALRKRMQGKSCSNFKEYEAILFKELSELTKTAYQRFQTAGYI